jgi:diguanylate cyclase (GGDEF)-like protein/PAS domain S-box-containing protein
MVNDIGSLAASAGEQPDLRDDVSLALLMVLAPWRSRQVSAAASTQVSRITTPFDGLHLVRTTCRNLVCLNIPGCAADSPVALHVTTPRPTMSSHHISTTVDSSQATWDAAAMLDALPERVNRYRVRDLAILYCNAAWGEQYGVDPSQAIGRRLDAFLSDDEIEGMHAQLARLGPDTPVLDDCVARAVPGRPGQWLQWVDRYLIGPDGPEVLSIGRDVTERHVAEIKLAESEARFRDLADHSSDIVWHFELHPSPHFDYVSPSVERILGYPPAYFLDDFTRIFEVLDEDGRSTVARALRGELLIDCIDFQFRHNDGSTVIGETRTTVVHGGMQGVSRDVTELRHLQASLSALALRDPLTGLANRRLLAELLDAELARTDRTGAAIGVAYIDVDNLKHVNDTYGHEAGDVVLRETARRLTSVVWAADLVARLGGDEFVVVYDSSDPDAADLLGRIDRTLAEPIDLGDGTMVTCPASVGTADTRTVGHDRAGLLAAADIAMYRVKRARRDTAR